MPLARIRGHRVGGYFEVAADPRDIDPSVPGWPDLSWETGSFEVPIDTDDARVRDNWKFYQHVYEGVIERKAKLLCQEVQVLRMDGPRLDDHPVAYLAIDPDRKRYILRALVRRTPIGFRFTVPDEMAGLYEQAGFTRVG